MMLLRVAFVVLVLATALPGRAQDSTGRYR